MMLDALEYSDRDIVVIIGSMVFRYLEVGYLASAHVDKFAALVEELKTITDQGGLFVHTNETTGEVTMAKVVPGSFVRVMMGRAFKTYVREQRAMAQAMAGHAPGVLVRQ